jgi:MFS family permease
MIARRTIILLGLSQLVCWGISYYLIGAFGPFIAADFGWSATLVYGGFSAALVVMGVISPLAGRLIDRHGGAPVMTAGSVATVLGCLALAFAQGPIGYYAAWLCLGVAMRLTLYDAAFAALARIGGPTAKRPIAQITLAGGLASTVFWPIGHALATAFGWRNAALAYAGFALLTVLLHLAIPRGRYQPNAQAAAPSSDPGEAASPPTVAPTERDPTLAAALYALIVALTTFLNSGMSAHMIAILGGLGLAASAAVGIATLRGIGQSSARLAEVLFGGKLHPLALGVLATSLLPVCFVAGLFSGQWLAAGAAFALLYGAGNGLVTIVRGTVPLVLFEHHVYGAVVGRLLVPSFFLSALAPIVYALVIERFGDAAALYLSLATAAAICAAAITLHGRYR